MIDTEARPEQEDLEALAGVPVYAVKHSNAIATWSDYQKAFGEIGL